VGNPTDRKEETLTLPEEVVAPVFKPATLKIRLEDPDEAENFLRGLIIARSNNSSEYFVDLIDGVNAVMQDYRGEVLKYQIARRDEANRPRA
jgi:nitrate reductase alpha subunit